MAVLGRVEKGALDRIGYVNAARTGGQVACIAGNENTALAFRSSHDNGIRQLNPASPANDYSAFCYPRCKKRKLEVEQHAPCIWYGSVLIVRNDSIAPLGSLHILLCHARVFVAHP
jgi:hypothetical protein